MRNFFSHGISLLAESPAREVVLAGDRNSPEAAALLAVIAEQYRPNTVLLWHDEATEQLAPFTKGQGPIGGKATAYVCAWGHAWGMSY